MNVEAVVSQHNIKGLRRLHDYVETHTRSLKSLGVDSYTYGTLLASVLVSKIPEEWDSPLTPAQPFTPSPSPSDVDVIEVSSDPPAKKKRVKGKQRYVIEITNDT